MGGWARWVTVFEQPVLLSADAPQGFASPAACWHPPAAHALLCLRFVCYLSMPAVPPRLLSPCSRCTPADKPRGYAFIEYEHKKDMKEAYKQSDGRKIEGRRILVDVERGRTVESW